jgi:hypothetical protein
MEQQKFHQIELGKNKFQLSTQAIIMFVFTFMLVLLGLILPFLKNKTPMPIFAFNLVLFAIVAIGYAILVAYAINCMIVGKCIKLTWAFVGIYAFFVLIYLMTTIFVLQRGIPMNKNEVFSVSPIKKPSSKK